jgi:predicted SprT family Zn-dependent metalloprotease
MKWTQALLDLFGPPTGGPNHLAPEPRPVTGADRVLDVVRRAGGAWERVILTRNRRIMASVSRGGRDLRLHEAFSDAPEPVLRAVAELFTSRSRRRRDAARSVVREFILSLPAAEPARPRERKPLTAPSDVRHLARLQREFDRVNAAYFDGTLPRVPIHLSRRMRSRNGHFSSRPVEIVINRRLCSHGAPGEAEHTVRHEMVHLWQHASGRPVDHGRDFRDMARRLDVHPRATRNVRWGQQSR